MYIYVCIHIHTRMCIYIYMYIYIYIYICSRVPPPCSQRSRTTGTNPHKPEGGRTMENDPSQCFFTGAEKRIRAGTGAPFARRKEQHHILYGDEHVTMTLLLTSGSNHRGWANQNGHRRHPTAGGGDKARHDDITTNKRQQPYHTSVEPL